MPGKGWDQSTDRVDPSHQRAIDDFFGDGPDHGGGFFPGGDADGAMASAPQAWGPPPFYAGQPGGYDDVPLGPPSNLPPPVELSHSTMADGGFGAPPGASFLDDAARAGILADRTEDRYYGLGGHGPDSLVGDDFELARARAMQMRQAQHAQPTSDLLGAIVDISKRPFFPAAVGGAAVVLVLLIGFVILSGGDEDGLVDTSADGPLSSSTSSEGAAASALGPTTSIEPSELPEPGDESTTTTAAEESTTVSDTEPDPDDEVVATTAAPVTTVAPVTTAPPVTTPPPPQTSPSTTTRPPSTTPTTAATTTTAPTTTTEISLPDLGDDDAG